jgi:hypothetical protein
LLRSREALFIPALVGALSGAVTSVVVNSLVVNTKRPPSRDVPVDRITEHEVSRVDPRVWSSILETRSNVATLEQRISALEHASGEAKSTMPDVHLSLDGDSESVLDRHVAGIEAHRSELIDPDWGPKSSNALKEALDHLTDVDKFSVENIDCRKSSCVATLKWANLLDAQKGYGGLLTANLGDLNCSTEGVLPQSSDDTQPVEATLLLSNCRR